MSLSFIAYRTADTKNSFNALIAAIDRAFREGEVLLQVASDGRELREALAKSVEKASTPSGSSSPPPVVAFSLCTRGIWKAADLAARIRERYGNRLLCLAGGPHPTADPEGTLDLGFDVVVRGEGEETLPELLAALQDARDLHGVPGIVYRNGRGDRIETGRRPCIDPIDRYDSFSPRWSTSAPPDCAPMWISSSGSPAKTERTWRRPLR